MANQTATLRKVLHSMGGDEESFRPPLDSPNRNIIIPAHRMKDFSERCRLICHKRKGAGMALIPPPPPQIPFVNWLELIELDQSRKTIKYPELASGRSVQVFGCSAGERQLQRSGRSKS